MPLPDPCTTARGPRSRLADQRRDVGGTRGHLATPRDESEEAVTNAHGLCTLRGQRRRLDFDAQLRGCIGTRGLGRGRHRCDIASFDVRSQRCAALPSRRSGASLARAANRAHSQPADGLWRIRDESNRNSAGRRTAQNSESREERSFPHWVSRARYHSETSSNVLRDSAGARLSIPHALEPTDPRPQYAHRSPCRRPG